MRYDKQVLFGVRNVTSLSPLVARHLHQVVGLVVTRLQRGSAENRRFVVGSLLDCRGVLNPSESSQYSRILKAIG